MPTTPMRSEPPPREIPDEYQHGGRDYTRKDSDGCLYTRIHRDRSLFIPQIQRRWQLRNDLLSVVISANCRFSSAFVWEQFFDKHRSFVHCPPTCTEVALA
jgi:hypothetical protein